MAGNRSSQSHAAGILAELSRISTSRGDAALARTRLVECMSLLQAVGSIGAGAVALEAAAELAVAVGEPERAVEFYGARARILRRARVSADARSSSLDLLVEALGKDRFDAAWAASRATPFPFEFYVCATLQWLEGLEARMPSPSPGSTAELLVRTRDGDFEAREKLAGKYLEPLRRFAHGRLPGNARDLMDTDDLVQDTVVRALDNVQTIQPKRKGSFFAYLRRILTNQVRDQIRRTAKRSRAPVAIEGLRSEDLSPLDQAIEGEFFETYELALSRLSIRQREALTLRIEHGLSYQQVADAIGCSSANAARMVVSRALVSVSEFLESK